MLVRLVEIDTEDTLRGALGHPIRKEEHALYVTEFPAYAHALAEEKLPCIFAASWPGDGSRETAAGDDPDQSVYGVDMVVCENHRAKDAGQWKQDEQFLLNIWKRHYGVPWLIAQTERLLIRESVMEDLPQLLALYAGEKCNPDVEPLSSDPEEELCAYIKKRYPFFGYGLWSVVEKASGDVVGRVGVEEKEAPEPGDTPGTQIACAALELSYLIGKKYRRLGYAREAARAVLAYAGSELGFREICLRTSPKNAASRHLAKSLGFREDGRWKNYFRLDLTNS